MPTRAEYTEDQFTFSPPTVDAIRRRTMAAGYTIGAAGVTYTSSEIRPYVVNVAEDLAWLDLLAAINATEDPTLAWAPAQATLTADGLATTVLTINDSRGAGALGKQVQIAQSGGMGYVPRVPAGSVTLDADGQAQVTFGPTGIPISFGVVARYENDEAAPALAPITVSA